MFTKLKSHSLLVNICGRAMRLEWNELDGLKIPAITEAELTSVLRRLTQEEPTTDPQPPTRKEAERVWNDPRVEVPKAEPMADIVRAAEVMENIVAKKTNAELVQEADAAVDALDRVTIAGVEVSATKLVEAIEEARKDATPEPAEEPAPQEREPEDFGDEAEVVMMREHEEALKTRSEAAAAFAETMEHIAPWPVVGESWLGVEIVDAAVRQSGGEDYAKLVLQNGDRVKVIRTVDGMLLEGQRLEAAQSTDGPPTITTTAKEPSAPEGAEAAALEAVGFLPTPACRTSKKASDTVRWLIEGKGIKDEAELVRICCAYREHKICAAFASVVDMDRRVEATLRALGVKV